VNVNSGIDASRSRPGSDEARVRAALAEARLALLDLSTRNRLLSLPLEGRSAGVVPIEGEHPARLWRMLAADRGKGLGFAGQPVDPAKPKGRRKAATRTVAEPAQGQLPVVDPEDDLLSSPLAEDLLVTRLTRIEKDARVFAEEQGVNVLYLALGALVWHDPAAPKVERRAPLVLLPVTLTRASARAAFRLRASGDDASPNLTLALMLHRTHGIDLAAPEPFGSDDEAAWDAVEAWFARLAPALVEPGFRIEPDRVALGLFSGAKVLMHRDLDPDAWPGLLRNQVVRALLVGGQVDPGAVPLAGPADTMGHVLDADASQAEAVARVRAGSHLVVQGPPGTGKSQTIANILAEAIQDGRSVLFVAEKLAALEVVRRRLATLGLGPACLPLHSAKAARREVLDELRATLAVTRARSPGTEAARADLLARRAELDEAVAALHRGSPSAYQAIAALLEPAPNGAVPIPAAQAWSEVDHAAAREAAEALAVLQPPGSSTWAGTAATELGTAEIAALGPQIQAALQALGGLAQVAREAGAGQVGAGEPGAGQTGAAGQAGAGQTGAAGQAGLETLDAVRRAIAAATIGAEAPIRGRGGLAHPSWLQGTARAATVVDAASAWTAVQRALGPRLTEAAWTAPGLPALRQKIASSSSGLLGLFDSGKQRTEAEFAGLCRTSPPRAQGERLALLDALIAGQEARARLVLEDRFARDAFGDAWQGLDSDPAGLAAVLRFVETAGPERAALAAGPSTAGSERLGAALAAFDAAFGPLADALALDPRVAFGSADPKLTAIGAKLAQWAGGTQRLGSVVAWNRAAEPLRRVGASPLVEALEAGRLAPGDAVPALRRAIAEAALGRAKLAPFDGRARTRRLAAFRDADAKRLDAARAETVFAHATRVEAAIADPRLTEEVQLLRAELARKRSNRGVRSLLRATPGLTRALKPVVMMSPLSVAQFLDPALPPFDLLVIDEASQIEPVDALGAIARATRIVVVGDDRQLPPTRFFQKMTSESEDAPEDEDAPASATQIESVLSLAAARGLPQTMLRWHYRSRHDSLIAPSNELFYGGGLVLLPSPLPPGPGLGVSLVAVEGVFDAGRTATNRIEAEAVADAVLRHAAENPKASLGVAAFSAAQAEAIEEAVQVRRAKAPELEPFFTGHEHEPFFVKNLESVQGDERDVMFLSVGYARDKDGKLAMRFGPLAGAGGERRLNVLITRAKSAVVVFSGIKTDDIDTDRVKGAGVAGLKAYLAHAARGGTAPSRAGAGATSEDPIGAWLEQAIVREGMVLRRGIGRSGLRLELVASSRDAPDLPLLAIETDGPHYASMPSARDRDRLRDGALERMGWRIHRVMAEGLLADQGAELGRLSKAMREAGLPALEAPKQAEPSRLPGLAQPYREAAPARPDALQPSAVPFATLAGLVAGIVEVEAPILAEAVAHRVASLWGEDQADAATRAAVGQALTLGSALHGLVVSGETWSTAGSGPVVPRDRRAASVWLREPDLVPGLELRAAVQAVLRAAGPQNATDLARLVRDALGLGPEVEARITAELTLLGMEGVVIERAGRIEPAAP